MVETKKEKKDPKVTVFNEEVDENAERRERFSFREHRRHGSFTWGLILVLVGAILLLSNFGALSPAVWSQLAQFWPVIIILIGIETLFGKSDTSDAISSVIGLFIFFTILGVVFLQVSPNLLSGLPAPILNNFQSLSGFLKFK